VDLLLCGHQVGLQLDYLEALYLSQTEAMHRSVCLPHVLELLPEQKRILPPQLHTEKQISITLSVHIQQNKVSPFSILLKTKKSG
jgi:hypothetical protein